MAKYLVCVSDERHASYEIERAILEKAGAELKLCHCESAADIAAQCAVMPTPFCWTLLL